jgi:hypothetical protein
MRRVVGFVLAIGFFGSSPSGAVTWADDPPADRNTTVAPLPDRVEEDWMLVVATPDAEGVGPQITTSMGPTADRTTAPFVAFDMNYREYPSFLAGGMQLQVWSGETLLRYATSNTEQFNTQGETITWTQRMSLSDGQITYQVASGSSTTWGNFGNGLSIRFATDLTSLAGYSPDTTVANSGASWQVNNVKTMTLVAIRYYAGGVLISTDSTARPLVIDGVSAVPVAAPPCPPCPCPPPICQRGMSQASTMPAALANRRGRKMPLSLA